MKTEAITRRALEKCMFERLSCLVSVFLGILKTEFEMPCRGRQVQGDLLILEPDEGSAQP